MNTTAPLTVERSRPAPAVEPAHPGLTPTRWFGSGRSLTADARTAGDEATRDALAGRVAGLVVVFCPATTDIEAMLTGVRAAAGGAPVIGCTGMYQFTADPAAGRGQERAVVVSALGAPASRSGSGWPRTCRAGSARPGNGSPRRSPP